jgi:DNA-binding transcriptional LysR family regulator
MNLSGGEMELRILRYFVEAAKEKSMTAAAQKLRVAQPTLSRQIKELEQELGQKLFIRSSYSTNLTPQKELLYKRALDILEMAKQTRAEFASMQEFGGGGAYLGCAESQGMELLSKAAKALENKNLHFHLYSGNAETVCERLDKGLLDFALVEQNIDLSRYCWMDLPVKDTWGIIMRKDSPLASQKEIEIETLAKLPLIVSRQGATSEMPSWLRQNYDRLNIIVTYD